MRDDEPTGKESNRYNTWALIIILISIIVVAIGIIDRLK